MLTIAATSFALRATFLLNLDDLSTHAGDPTISPSQACRRAAHLSSSGCTQTYGESSRCPVSLIMRTGGENRGARHERHFSAGSSFQIGVLRGRRIASSGKLARVLHRLHSPPSQPSPPLMH